MTAPQGTAPGTASPERIRRMRHVTAMVALDTIDLLAERVLNLLAAGRRVTTARRYTYTDQAPEVTAGLTLDGRPEQWKNDRGAGFVVHLTPGALNAFGFSCYGHDGNGTEQEARARFHAAKAIADSWFDRRRDMTEVTINGGLPGDGPAVDDSLTIRYWNRDGVCRETVVAFDYHTGRDALRAVRDELADHMANLRDMQPWDNRAMFERLLAGLNAHVGSPAVASQEAGR